jgi:hypothetical protein
MKVLTFSEFVNEGKKGLTNAGTIMRSDNKHMIKTAVNFSDETLENLRRQLLDKYYKSVDSEDGEKRANINKAISTYVYCLDKKLRIDGDIIDLLAKELGKKKEELTKELTKLTDEFYGGLMNHYGMT